MTAKIRTIDVPKSATLADLEALFSTVGNAPAESSLRLRTASTFDGGILADIWAAILIGTASRRLRCELIGWGLKEQISPSSTFAMTPAFLTGASVASSICPEVGDAIDQDRARRYFATRHDGLIDPASGASQMLVEFDPDYRDASILRSRMGSNVVTPTLRTRMFEQLVLRFRRQLEIGANRRSIDPRGRGPAGDLGKFLAELHENGSEHGSRGEDGKTLPGTRFLRVKKHVANSKQQLLERSGSFGELRAYVEAAVPDTGGPALIEASISDFGLGIVDGFSRTPAAVKVSLDRRALLDELIYGRLSSKSSDPSAGLGIQKALDAARRMSGFVSLRTGEFWLSASFAGSEPNIRLQDVPGQHPSVTGTHWQLLWLQP
jgi:hypothetical protein